MYARVCDVIKKLTLFSSDNVACDKCRKCLVCLGYITFASSHEKICLNGIIVFSDITIRSCRSAMSQGVVRLKLFHAENKKA